MKFSWVVKSLWEGPWRKFKRSLGYLRKLLKLCLQRWPCSEAKPCSDINPEGNGFACSWLLTLPSPLLLLLSPLHPQLSRGPSLLAPMLASVTPGARVPGITVPHYHGFPQGCYQQVLRVCRAESTPGGTISGDGGGFGISKSQALGTPEQKQPMSPGPSRLGPVPSRFL